MDNPGKDILPEYISEEEEEHLVEVLLEFLGDVRWLRVGLGGVEHEGRHSPWHLVLAFGDFRFGNLSAPS